MKFLVARERLAAYAHEAWVRWMRYLFSKCQRSSGGAMIIPSSYVENLERLMNTPYTEMTEEEKESDRREAHRMIIALVYGAGRKDSE